MRVVEIRTLTGMDCLVSESQQSTQVSLVASLNVTTKCVILTHPQQ